MSVPHLAAGGNAGVAGGCEAGSACFSDGLASAVVLVVGGDVADALVQSHGVVVLLSDVEFAAQDRGVIDGVQVGVFAFEVAEERLDPGLVVGGAGAAEVLGDPGDRHELRGLGRAHLRAVVRDRQQHRETVVVVGHLTAGQLASGQVPDNDDRLPVLLAVSDNGPQMRSTKTAEFMAIARIAQHFGRPGTPNDQAWIESFFGHLKGEHPYLDAIDDPAVLRRELDIRKEHYNTVRLHEGIGYVTPDDEHHGRGEAIRKARRAGLTAARNTRIATRRQMRHTHPKPTSSDEDI